MSSAQTSFHDPAPMVDEPLQFPCSVAQERFWVLDRIEPGNPALNIAVRWQLDGHVSADLVERAFGAIIARHEILRTGFAEIDGTLFQRVLPSAPFRIATVDLTGLRDDQRPGEATRIGQIEAQTGFDLASPPLLRVTLVRLADSTSLLLVTIHHMVCDGWSVGILAREFGQHYDDLRHGRAGALPDLAIQYGDYALWYRECLRCGEFGPEIAYWKKQLSGLPYLEVPADKPHRASVASASDIEGLLLDRTLTDALQAVSGRQGNTLFVTVLAALVVLLNRYTGESDIAVGTQVIGRDEIELEDMVGVFINTVVLRSDVSDNPRMSELLQRTQEIVQGALEHQNLAMERLIQILQPKRDMTRNPFFSVNFIFQRSFIENQRFSDFSLVDLPSHSPGGLYDLNFFMVERPEGWRISCEYNSDLFLRETVSHQLQGLRTLFAAIVQDPERRVAVLPLLDDAEQRRLLQLGSGARAFFPVDRPVHRLLEEQVLRSPKSIAVVHDDQRLTYAQLDKAANRLAQYLYRQGVLPGTRVGLLLPRGTDLVVTLLAVLKAGGVVVGFDPACPADRLDEMFKDIRLPLILTETHRPDLFAKAERVFALDAIRTAVAREHGSRLEVEHTGEPLAYVAFAGRNPVELSHRALVNLLCGLAQSPGLDARDTLVAVNTMASHLAPVELLLPLMIGARLVLASSGQCDDGTALVALLQRSKATVMQARPAIWLKLLEGGWTGVPRLRMWCGGDRISRPLADRLLATGGELWSLYGVADAGLWSLAARIEPGSTRVPLGDPLPNMEAHILDRNGGLLPVGAVGELHIRAAGAGRDGRTGDLARRRHDGRIEYAGRAGPPAKRRGFRIELLDIEAEILSHPDVSETAVTLARAENGSETLTAFVVPRVGQSSPALLAETLKVRLGGAFPKYMVPDSISVLSALPRSFDGRIEHRQLGAVADLSVAEDRKAPGGIESRMIRLWSSLLGRPDIGATDDFFDLGGHSLLAARLIAGISKEFGTTLDFATLFHAPTVRALAELVGGEKNAAADSPVLPVQPEGRLAPVFGIDHTWIYDHLASQLGPERPFFAVQTRYASTDGTERTLQHIAAEQVRSIRRQQSRGPYVLLGLCAAGVLAFEIAQQLQDQGENVPLLIMIDTWSPGYLARQSPAKRKLADLSYRWQILLSDFRRGAERGMLSMLTFGLARLRGYAVKRMRGALPKRAAMQESGEELDPIVLLRAATRSATQRPFTGRICLFHRDTMPSGRFLDAQLGWGDFAAGVIETHRLPGDHFSMFRDPGVTKMAEIINRALQAEQV